MEGLTMTAPDVDPPVVKPRRRLLIIVVALAVLLAGGAVTAGVIATRDKPSTPTGAASAWDREQASKSAPLPADACGGGVCNPTASPEPEPIVVAETDGPWTPCDPEATDVLTGDPTDESGCEDLLVDACDGAYTASIEGKGQLLDVFIENRDVIDAARLKDCPKFLPAWKQALTGFAEGSQEVGVDVKPGTYETTSHLSGGRVTDCYWERSGKNGKTIDNDLITAAKKVRVTIRKTDQYFTSERCGDWVRV